MVSCLEVGLAGLITSTSGNWWNYICPGYPAFCSHHIFRPLWSCSPQMTWCFKTCNSYYPGKLILQITNLGHYFWQRRTQNDFSVLAMTTSSMEQESFHTPATLCSLFNHHSTKGCLKTWRHEVQAILFSCLTTFKRRKKNQNYVDSTLSIFQESLLLFISHQHYYMALTGNFNLKMFMLYTDNCSHIMVQDDLQWL